ncbi:hypothetical protein AGLY_004658 [Aphis glycines]|uniref:Uncharacterized protein n=1 Tax=Aphis glycines TaxID=307491 RepID=A0A6G0TVS8_APHGL|nr:hypothetical protein AGLY_004658 [Aphis glycines]
MYLSTYFNIFIIDKSIQHPFLLKILSLRPCSFKFINVLVLFLFNAMKSFLTTFFQRIVAEDSLSVSIDLDVTDTGLEEIVESFFVGKYLFFNNKTYYVYSLKLILKSKEDSSYLESISSPYRDEVIGDVNTNVRLLLINYFTCWIIDNCISSIRCLRSKILSDGSMRSMISI